MNATLTPRALAVIADSGETGEPIFRTPCSVGSGEVDVHAILRNAEAQKQARAAQLPTEQDCIRMMVQCRLRLIELGWREGEYAPRDGTEFTAINAGFTGPSKCVHLGSGYFVADGGDWWPTPRPLVFRAAIAAATEGAV